MIATIAVIAEIEKILSQRSLSLRSLESSFLFIYLFIYLFRHSQNLIHEHKLLIKL